MNRKQRRAAVKRAPSAPVRAASAGSDPTALFVEALRHEQQRQFDDAARSYRRLLALKPAHAEAYNNLGRVLQAQSKPQEASAAYARALTLMPQLLDQYAGICGTLAALLPALGEALRRAADNWPRRLGIDELLGDGGFAAIARDPLLRSLLEATPVREIALERLLTMLRAGLLAQATADTPADDDMLAFTCALARQCFINDYVFVVAPDEDAHIVGLKARPAASLTPLQVAALAMYEPLGALAIAQDLLSRPWPPQVEDVLTQQIREPAQERALQAAMPRLTAIEDVTSQRVRAQYEENPYPRWVRPAGQVEPVALDDYLRAQFPAIPFAASGKTESLDILIAGCGTGWQAVSVAQKFLGARVFAVDLSLASLAYAKRNTPAEIGARVEYAQADILKLGTLERRFDVIEASGVLHHTADWREAWRVLVSRLAPDGFMHIGLYSEAARRDVVAARTFIADGGYRATPEEIRRCRQDLIATPLRSVARFADFFSTSECRDLLFHTQEARVTIPEIKAFLAEANLRFIGFDFDAGTQQRVRALFAQSGWSLTDLDRWHTLETAEPNLFAGMFQFWVQKR